MMDSSVFSNLVNARWEQAPESIFGNTWKGFVCCGSGYLIVDNEVHQLFNGKKNGTIDKKGEVKPKRTWKKKEKGQEWIFWHENFVVKSCRNSQGDLSGCRKIEKGCVCNVP
jgi:hypothetical protein